MSFEGIYFGIVKRWKTLMPEENAALQLHLGTGSAPVSSSLHDYLSGCRASYHLYLQNHFLRKDPSDFEDKGK